VRPLLSIGAAGYFDLLPTDIVARTNSPMADTDVDGNHRIDNVAIWQGGLELRALYRGASLQAELFRRLEDPGAAGPNRNYWGGYVQGGYFVLPHRLEVAARVGHTDLPLYGATAAEHLLAGSWQNEQSGVVAAYVRGHRVKAQAEYSHLSSNGESAPTINRVQGALQIGF
jgi:phosphate-selective porin OprO/OprP